MNHEIEHYKSAGDPVARVRASQDRGHLRDVTLYVLLCLAIPVALGLVPRLLVELWFRGDGNTLVLLNACQSEVRSVKMVIYDSDHGVEFEQETGLLSAGEFRTFDLEIQEAWAEMSFFVDGRRYQSEWERIYVPESDDDVLIEIRPNGEVVCRTLDESEESQFDDEWARSR